MFPLKSNLLPWKRFSLRSKQGMDRKEQGAFDWISNREKHLCRRDEAGVPGQMQEAPWEEHAGCKKKKRAARTTPRLPLKRGKEWGRPRSVNVCLRPPNISMWSWWLLKTRICIYRERRGTRTYGPGEKTQAGRTEALDRQPAWLPSITIHTQNIIHGLPRHSPRRLGPVTLQSDPALWLVLWMNEITVPSSFIRPSDQNARTVDHSHLFWRVSSRTGRLTWNQQN